MTEALVKEAFHAAYEEPGRLQCACARCTEDILALALNHLRPHYVSTEAGFAYVKAQYFNPQLQSDILRELAVAVQIVEAHPRHPAVGE